MAAQVELKTGEGTRAGVVGGRMHLSPLADSSNKSPVEVPSSTQGPLILAPEPSKPVPGPKPRLTPKPFALDKNPTIRPIPAPKPHTKPRPELTRPTSYKPDPPSTPKPALTKPAHASAHRPVPTNPKRPTPTSLKPAPKPAPAHTAKPTVQPYKPAPPPSSGEPAKLTLREAVKSPGPRPGLLQKRGSRAPPAAEWSGTTQQEGERARTEASGRVGAPIARAKSLGFLNQTSQEDEKPSGGGKGGEAAAAPVPMRPQPKGSRPRPVSAVFLPSPTQSESPGPPAPSRWTGRRPLSADLTAKFESIGLSLHRRPGKADSKENTPERGREEDGAPAQRKDKEKGVELTPSSPSMFLTTPDPEYKPMPTVPEQKNERKEPEEKEEEKSGGSIKRRISLLFDSSSSSAVGGLSVAGAEPRPAAAQPIPETDVPVGVKQRIKKLIEDTPPTQTPSPKAPFKPRPLPSDLTKKFAAENLVELSSLSPRSLEREESKGQQQDGSDAHGKDEDSAMGLTDGAREAKEERVVFQFPQDQPAYTSTDQSGVSMEERRVESEAQEACPSGGVQTVRAALFENVVERHSVHVVEEAGGGAGAGQLRRSISLRQKEGEDDGQGGIALTGATAPASPLRVEHVFDTVSAIGEKRAVVESLPPAQLEDKAMTLRSRRSGAEGMARGGHVEDKPQQPHSPRDPPRAKPEATSLLPEQAPRYLRVGGLKKWGTEEVKREGQAEPEAEVGLWGESDRQKPESAMQFESEIERQREWEREEVGAPKRLKMLEGDDPQPKPRATYFALTGQMQEPQPVDNYSVEGSGGEDITVEDFSAKFGRWGSQGPVRRNPSLDAAFAKSSLSEASGQGSLAGRDQTPKEREAFREMETEQELKTQRDMEWERQRELEQLRATEREKETERQRETERQMEVETERRREMERQKEMETQRELQRQRERVRGMERQLLELEKQRQAEKVRLERQRETERQKEMERQLLELEKQRRAEREKAERQREMERQRELERQRQQEIEKLREMERQRELERQREMERQKEMERQLLELEKQRRAEREKAERQRAMERQRELERERQQEIEKLREMERQRDMERQRELERQREMDRQKEMERQLLELEKQRRAEREKAERQREMERQLDIERQKFLEFEKRKDIEMERREEIEREKQREIERAGQREMENRRQRELERVRQEMERQKETARQREIERQKEMERQLLELEKQRRAEREKEREAKEKEQERVRQLLRQQDMERQRAMEREREIVKREEVMSTLRPGVLDLDSVSLADQHLKVSQSSDPRLKLPSPHNEDTYRLAILDIDSFRSQTHPAPPIEAFPAVGIQGLDSGATLWSQPHTPEERPVGRPSPVWSSSQLEFWEQTPIAPGSWLAPEPPQKPASKPSLEQLLLGQEERLAAPSLVPERQWSGLPADSGSTSAWAPFPRRETTGSGAPESHRHGYTDPAPLESPWVLRDPVTPAAQEQRAEPRTQQGQQGPHAKDLTRTRSRSVSRRSAPAESPLEGPLSRMRSRSAHRETDIRSWEQLKQCVGAEDEGRDTDTLVQETDSQYGTWDTGLRTDDSLTPATPSSDSNLSSSPRKQTPPHTPGDPATPSGFDTPDSLSPGPVPETEPLPFPETTTTLLDSSALRSRVQLGKMRNKRALPSRAARQNAALSVPQEGQGGAGDDWRYRDSTEEKGQSSRQEDSDPEEQPRGAELRPPASLPQRVALFPGMDPSALKAQLKKRGDSDNQTDGASPSSSQLSRSPKSPFLARASRVLPPAGGKENGEESSPQWLRELKSKKRLSQYENDT